MAEGNRGGARPGSGRKKTGLQTRHYTINLPLDVAEEMEKRAAQMNKTVNKYLRDIIISSGQYWNVGLAGSHVDDESELLAADSGSNPYYVSGGKHE